MNGKEFREDCRVLANDIVEDHMKWRNQLDYPKKWVDAVDSFDFLKAAALLYIAANMPGLDESNEKPCEYCNPKKRKIFHNPCGSISHYLYVNTQQKKLADAYDKTEDKWVAIKYCPFCRRKL